MWSTYGHTQTIGTCVAGEVKNGILDTHTNNVVSVLTHTRTIGKQKKCVAGGVKTDMLDTHTNSVVSVRTHTHTR